jgi:UDP-glucuronate decarboxylase
MSKILVSGGAGFIGSNLCGRLLDHGDMVYCLDNLSTSSANNIADYYSNNRFHLMLGDVANCRPEIEVNQIYSLASPTAPGAYQKDPEGTLEANIAGTENLLKMATEQKARILVTSSIRVTEPLELQSPHSCYVDGKKGAEELCREYHDKHGTDVKIARLYNTYGPRMARDDTRVVPTFIRRALAGEPLKIAGDGTQRDSFCYIDDMLDALIRYMASDIQLGPVEFGYPLPIAIIDLAKLAIRATGSKSKIEFNGVVRSARELEIKKFRPVPDIREAQARLGWIPRTSLEVGLARMAAYYGGMES